MSFPRMLRKYLMLMLRCIQAPCASSQMVRQLLQPEIGEDKLGRGALSCQAICCLFQQSDMQMVEHMHEETLPAIDTDFSLSSLMGKLVLSTVSACQDLLAPLRRFFMDFLLATGRCCSLLFGLTLVDLSIRLIPICVAAICMAQQ